MKLTDVIVFIPIKAKYVTATFQTMFSEHSRKRLIFDGQVGVEIVVFVDFKLLLDDLRDPL